MKNFKLTDTNGKTLVEGSSVVVRSWAKLHNETMKYSISEVNARYFGENLNKEVSLLQCVNEAIKANQKDKHSLGCCFYNGMEITVI